MKEVRHQINVRRRLRVTSQIADFSKSDQHIPDLLSAKANIANATCGHGIFMVLRLFIYNQNLQ